MERVRRIELPSLAWKAIALPLSYTRIPSTIIAPADGPIVHSTAPQCSTSPHRNVRHPDRHHNQHIWRLDDTQIWRTWWWRELDSNQRRHSQRVYSPSPLATRASLRNQSIASVWVVLRSATMWKRKVPRTPSRRDQKACISAAEAGRQWRISPKCADGHNSAR